MFYKFNTLDFAWKSGVARGNNQVLVNVGFVEKDQEQYRVSGFFSLLFSIKRVDRIGE